MTVEMVGRHATGARAGTMRERHQDARLVLAAQAGDVGAFSELVSRYRNLVCSIAFQTTGSLVKSEDVGQEVFVRAWSQLATLRSPSRFRNWICEIARNLSLNLKRNERKRALIRNE